MDVKRIYEVIDTLFTDRAHAIKVLDELQGIVCNYGFVTVADYYDAIGFKSRYLDKRFGWVDLSDARIINSDSQYRIVFPEVVELTDDCVTPSADDNCDNALTKTICIFVHTNPFNNEEEALKIINNIIRENPDCEIDVHIN